MPELLTVEDALSRHRAQVLDAIAKPKLQGLIWEATLACNLACTHCGNPVEGKEGDGPWRRASELRTEEIRRILSEIAEDFDASAISLGITGGEPTLRPDLCAVVAHARKLGFSVSLTTNCMLTGKDLALADRLVEAGVQLFTISLDGLREGHDRQRGIEGSFDRVVATIRHLRARHPDVGVTVNTIATPTNWREIPGVYSLVQELGVPLWNLGPVSPVGRAASPETHLTNEQLRDLLAWMAEKNRPANVQATGVRVAWVCDGWVGSQFEGRVREGMFFCGAGTRIASILYDGKAATCLEVRRDIGVQGDLREKRLSEVWSNEYAWFRKDRERFRQGPCATCSEWDWCQGSSLHLREADGALIECIFHRQSQAKTDEAGLPAIVETVELAELTIVERDGAWVVGNEDTGTFAQMPPIAVDVLRSLRAHPQIERARRDVRDRTGRDVDVAAFVRSIARGGFVAKVNGAALPSASLPKKQRQLFRNLRPERLAWMRTPWFWVATLVPFALALAEMAFDPWYRPGWRDFFFTDWLTVVGLTVFLVTGLSIVKHEMGHVLMARALGARAALTLGTRVTYLAVQTDASSLWVLSRRDRMKVYLAGMAVDAFVIGALTLLLGAGHVGLVPALAHPSFVALAKLVVLASFMTLAFQFFLHLRTDVYYVLAHAADCRDLYGDAQAWLKKRAARLVPRWRALAEPSAGPREMRWIRAYALLHFVGVALLLAYFLGLVVPTVVAAYGRALGTYWVASTGGAVPFRDLADATMFVGAHAAYFGVLGYVAWRDRRRTTAGLVAPAPDEATRRLLAHPAPEEMTRTVGGRLAQIDPARVRAVAMGPHMKAAALRERREAEALPPPPR